MCDLAALKQSSGKTAWPIGVAADGRSLVDANGRPWFWLADTAWSLFHRLTVADAEVYFDARAAQGFSVIQAVALAELGGLDVPTPGGELPLHGRDPARPNDAYFDHVVELVKRANARGLGVAVLPTWGEYLSKQTPNDEVIFTEESAASYGRYLVERLAGLEVCWMLGGDRSPKGVEPIWRAMGEAIRAADPKGFITWHAGGGDEGSDHWWPDESWLDAHGFQSGHCRRFSRNWQQVERAWNTLPSKPVLELEPCYENLPIGFHWPSGRFDAFDVRFESYQAAFSGAAGVTYGACETWGLYDPEHPGRKGYPEMCKPGCTWREALGFPGASQVQHLRDLMQRLPAAGRVPDRSLVIGGGGMDSDRISVLRDGAGVEGKPEGEVSFAAWYVPCPQPWIALDTACFGGAALRWSRFNPRDGQCEAIGPDAFASVPAGSKHPGQVIPVWPVGKGGPDWVLVAERV